MCELEIEQNSDVDRVQCVGHAEVLDYDISPLARAVRVAKLRSMSSALA